MELRQYWRVVTRRWWIVVGLPLLVTIFSLATLTTLPQPNPVYQATAHISVRPAESPDFGFTGYGEYYKYIASEYLNDDIIEVIQSRAFLAAIRDRHAQRPGGPPSGTIRGKKAHRIIQLTVDSANAADAMLIAESVSAVLSEPAPGKKTSVYFESLTEQNPTVAIVNPPAITVQPGGSRSFLDLFVRALLGLFAGLLIVFLLDYLDDTIRDGAEASRLTGLPLLGELPTEKGPFRGRTGAGK